MGVDEGNAEAGLTTVATDPEAFERFYREHLDLVRVYLARRVDDPLVVADLTADVFLRVIRTARTYRPDLGPPAAWLVGVARHVLADHRRSRGRERAALTRLAGRGLLDEDSAQRIVDRVAAERPARLLLASIATLPPALRAVTELVAVDGLPINQAATVLGISPGAARVRFHRARRRLHDSLHPQPLEVTP